MIDIVRHAPQDCVDDRFGGITPLGIVPGDFLDPFEVGDGHHTHQQVSKFGHVIAITNDATVQAFVEE